MSPLRFSTLASGRRVAWRAAGTGPAVLLLHGSPQSSKAVAVLGEAVAAAGFCAIMPDTPGAGFSAPLVVDKLTITELGVGLREFCDALGLGRVAIYGSHTGAAIGCVFASLYPERVAGLIFDGIGAWNDAERAVYVTDYAPPFLPVWDGSHLTWLWGRMEAQSLFFPWSRREPATWRGVDLSAPGHLHRNAMDMLNCGNAYRDIYLASLAFDPAEFLPRVSGARMILARSDVLLTHATRPALAHLPVTVCADVPGVYAAVVAALAEMPGDEAPALPAPGPFWRGTLGGAERPLVLLHGAGASSRVFEGMLAELAGPVIALDLPGHGFDESEMPGDAAAVAAIIAAQCAALGLTDYAVAGTRFGGVIAAMLGGADLVPRNTDPELAAQGAVSLAPVWDGTHLQRAWQVATRLAIFDPWYRTQADCARADMLALEPEAIHAAALDLLRAGPAWEIANRIEAAGGAAAAVLTAERLSRRSF
jgi:pimeloyl-ACP methyl ester carboxylesterase